MPIDFPSSPTNGQVYTVGARQWSWNASNNSWDAVYATTGPAGPAGPTGPIDPLAASYYYR